MRALVLDAERRSAHVADVPKPIPSNGQILVRVEAVALNPVDSLYVFNPLGATGRVVGSDFAGTVSAIGDNNDGQTELKIGDRVAGFVQGACSVNQRPGAFAEFVVCPRDLVWRVPDLMSLEEAATVSLCSLTAAQAWFYRLRLPAPFPWSQANFQDDLPSSEQDSAPLAIFIYGASTSVGLYAAQLIQHVKHATGKSVIMIGAASSKHFGTLKASPYSFDYLVDYRDSTWTETVSKLTAGTGLSYAYDCISEGNTVEKIQGLMKPDGKMAIVRSAEGGAWKSARTSNFQPSYGAVWEGLGEDVQYQGMHLPANAKARTFAAAFYKWLSHAKPLQPNKVRLMPGGLSKIASDGFSLLGSGSMGDRNDSNETPWMRPVSAEKLVYKVSDTGEIR